MNKSKFDRNCFFLNFEYKKWETKKKMAQLNFRHAEMKEIINSNTPLLLTFRIFQDAICNIVVCIWIKLTDTKTTQRKPLEMDRYIIKRVSICLQLICIMVCVCVCFCLLKIWIVVFERFLWDLPGRTCRNERSSIFIQQRDSNEWKTSTAEFHKVKRNHFSCLPLDWITRMFPQFYCHLCLPVIKFSYILHKSVWFVCFKRGHSMTSFCRTRNIA